MAELRTRQAKGIVTTGEPFVEFLSCPACDLIGWLGSLADPTKLRGRFTMTETARNKGGKGGDIPLFCNGLSRDYAMKTVRQLLQAKGNAVSTIAPNATAYDVMKLMADKNIGALLVLEGEKLVGIVSERDMARKIYLLERPARQIPVSEIMTKQVVCVRPDNTNEECMALMTDKRIRHLPVLDDDRLVGVISIGDLVKDTISEQQFIIKQLEHYIMGER